MTAKNGCADWDELIKLEHRVAAIEQHLSTPDPRPADEKIYTKADAEALCQIAIAGAMTGLERATKVSEEPNQLKAWRVREPKGNAILRFIDDLERRLREAEERFHVEIEKVAGCSCAAVGAWKEGDDLHPQYECAAIHDVAKLYQRMEAAERGNEGMVLVPKEIDRSKHGSVLMAWNDCMIDHETLEMTWPKLVDAMLAAAEEKKDE